jgi:gamma-glutamyltranspeptidase/glutathione hydrolase
LVNYPLILYWNRQAIYADEGYPVSPVVSNSWSALTSKYKIDLKESIFDEWFKTFTIDGLAPLAGQIWRSPELARSLRLIGETQSKSFYQGELAEHILSFSNKTGGYLQAADLENFSPKWVDPICTEYKGHTIWELPPNGHGLIVLLALNILKGIDLESLSEPQVYHTQIEALKLAFADALEFVSDPEYMKASVPIILSESYAAQRRKLIGNSALSPFPGDPYCGGTVYLATADSEGMMVSYIQSNYQGFGSGLVVPGTGIALQNRGSGFNLIPGHSNCLLPGKRPYHTIIPGFITKNNNPIGPFGVLGAYMQPQGHLQVISNLLDKKLNPQAALDAPRWQWIKDKSIWLEESFPSKVSSFLTEAGHDITISPDIASFGRGQIIWKHGEMYAAGTEARADSTIASW